MATSKIPAEIAHVLEKLRNTLSELTDEEVVSLDSTPQGREILDMLDDIKKTVGRELGVYQRIMGARRFHGRVFTFCREKKGKRRQWVRSETQLAEAEFLGNGVPHLRTLMLDMMQAEEDKALAMWVHPMPSLERDVFYGFVLHPDGAEAVVIFDGGNIIPMSWGEKQRALTLEMLLRRPENSAKRWASIVKAQISVMREALREDVTEFLTKNPGSMSDEVWEEFLHLLYARKEHLMLLQEVGRATGVSLLHESQKMVGAMVDLVEKALANHNEKLAGMEKTHARALKRFKTDLDKYRSARDVAASRTKQLEREMQSLRKQLQRTGSSTQSEQSNQNSIGLALDRFFLEPEHVS
jgi:hypothetical protein